MSNEKRIDSNEVPENDLLDQTIPIDPSDPGDSFEDNKVAPGSVNEADWIDQQIPVPVDDAGWGER